MQLLVHDTSLRVGQREEDGMRSVEGGAWREGVEGRAQREGCGGEGHGGRGVEGRGMDGEVWRGGAWKEGRGGVQREGQR